MTPKSDNEIGSEEDCVSRDDGTARRHINASNSNKMEEKHANQVSNIYSTKSENI